MASAVCARAGSLDGSLAQLVEGHDLRGARFAVCVIDADTGEILAELSADEPMIPASNMKLLTTSAALDVLGKDFVFRTELGVIEPAKPGGVPDLVIKGDGDPALGDPVLLAEYEMTAEGLLDQWVLAVKQAGVTSVRRLIVDDGVFDHQSVHPSWPAGQLNQHYCAQVAGINFHNNCLHVLPAPASTQGAGPIISMYPESPFLVTYNSATTGKSDSFWIDRKAGTNEMTFRGTVKNKFYTPVLVTLNDPPTYLAQLLSLRLGLVGIEVGEIARLGSNDQLPPARSIYRSQTLLSAVLKRTNRDSQNLYAEALLKRMGYALTGSPGSWENGPAAVRHALANRMGTRATGATVVDGSGLSRDNRVTARVLVELLTSMHNDPELSETFKASLAHAGKAMDGKRQGDGTLSKRFKKLPAGRWVYGKSGYIRSVSSLSGYLVVTDPQDPSQTIRTIAFSFLFNGFAPPISNRDLKMLQDQMVVLIDEQAGS